jgi:hypothetical protein
MMTGINDLFVRGPVHLEGKLEAKIMVDPAAWGSIMLPTGGRPFY